MHIFRTEFPIHRESAETHAVLILVGGSVTKRRLFESHIGGLDHGGIQILHFSPPAFMKSYPEPNTSPHSRDSILDAAERQRVVGVVPLVDSVVPYCDAICNRLGLPANNPITSSFRVDKERMQFACASAGLRYARSCRFQTLNEAISLWRDSFVSGEVVIKPPRSGGCDGVAVCDDIVSLSKHVQQQLYAINLEKLRNTELIMQEYLKVDCEYVVNTVSVRGRHFITDVWRGTPKRKTDLFLYDTQELVTDVHSIRDVIEYAKAVLTAVEVQHGACHIEIGAVEPQESTRVLTLIEVNARLAGEIRTSNSIPGWYGYDQVYWFLKSIINPEKFDVETDLQELYRNDNPVVIVVFLQNILYSSCCLSNGGIESIRQLSSFLKFGRGLAYANESGSEPNLRIIGRTVDLVSSPGVVMLVGPSAKADVTRVRDIEKRHLYINHAMTT